MRKLRRLDGNGLPKEVAALRVGIDAKTARKYRRLGKLPSEVKPMDRDWRTHPDAFAEVWPELEALLQASPRLEAKTLFAEHVEVFYGQKRLEQLPRLRGRGKHKIEYRHVIDWLVRKPGAFADYRYQADLFPSSRFRMAYDVLSERQPQRAAKEYLKILHLAARELVALPSEVGVESALAVLLEEGGPSGTAKRSRPP